MPNWLVLRITTNGPCQTALIKHRPLYRIALNDAPGTELYVSSTTGEVVLATTHHERIWNYVGSVAHWIYPTILRSNAAAWSKTVWTLSLVALIAAVAGVVLGVIRLQVSRRGLQTPFRGWHAWHHVLGLFSATFVLTFIFSGWLSMDSGLLFSSGRLSPAEQAGIAQRRIGACLRATTIQRRRGRRRWNGSLWASASIAANEPEPMLNRSSRLILPRRCPHPFLTAIEIDPLVRQIAPGCAAPVVVASDDNYPETSAVARRAGLSFGLRRCLVRSRQRDRRTDRAAGSLASQLPMALCRAAYADFPALTARPMLRSVLIVGLCTIGFLFSITGAVIGWRGCRCNFADR